MSRKKEYFLILFFSIVVTIFSYLISSYYFKNNFPEQEFENIPFIKKEKKVLKPISILFVGDIMLDRTIRKDGEKYGYENLFACLKKDFEKYDEIVGNLEGTVTDFQSVSRDAPFESPQSFRFTFDSKAVQSLKDIGLSIVSLANNHIKDFGNEGIFQTIKNTDRMNILTFGDPRKDSQRYLIKDINGTIIAFVPYNEFFGTKEETLEDLKNTKDISDIQIIFAHWGNEYVPPRKDVINLAHNFVDEGVDLIIGGHPHIIQEDEIYKDVSIYYSLGNFIFDQYWEDAVKEGMVVEISILDKKIIKQEKMYTESMRHGGTCFKKIL